MYRNKNEKESEVGLYWSRVLIERFSRLINISTKKETFVFHSIITIQFGNPPAISEPPMIETIFTVGQWISWFRPDQTCGLFFGTTKTMTSNTGTTLLHSCIQIALEWNELCHIDQRICTSNFSIDKNQVWRERSPISRRNWKERTRMEQRWTRVDRESMMIHRLVQVPRRIHDHTNN